MPLSTKPDAPARSMPASTSSSSNVVSASTGGAPSMSRSARVACTPSTSGIRTSISTTSGTSDDTAATTVVPSAHSPTTSNPNRVRRMPRNPARTSSWSSTSSTLITTPPGRNR
jgi:hypothetical protein